MIDSVVSIADSFRRESEHQFGVRIYPDSGHGLLVGDERESARHYMEVVDILTCASRFKSKTNLVQSILMRISDALAREESDESREFQKLCAKVCRSNNRTSIGIHMRRKDFRVNFCPV